MASNLEEPFDNEEYRSREGFQTRDREEHKLWEASQEYMAGNLSVEQLETVERPHSDYLKKAFIGLAPRIRRKSRIFREISEDDRERYLWVISRRYMAGDLTVEQLEQNEISHTERFNKAMIGVAKWTMWQSFLALLHINLRNSY
jgi:hypothetical protein